MKNIVLEEQMELTLAQQNAKRARRSRKAPPRRAGWWFGQMRRVVDKAIDWAPRQDPPAHQVYLAFDRHSPEW